MIKHYVVGDSYCFVDVRMDQDFNDSGFTNHDLLAGKTPADCSWTGFMLEITLVELRLIKDEIRPSMAGEDRHLVFEGKGMGMGHLYFMVVDKEDSPEQYKVVDLNIRGAEPTAYVDLPTLENRVDGFLPSRPFKETLSGDLEKTLTFQKHLMYLKAMREAHPALGQWSMKVA
jgi:hypothetical protein